MPPPLLDLAAWMSEHYLAPPGECYRAVLPPAGVRASRAVVRLVKPAEAGDGPVDPVLRHLQGGPLRLSALEKTAGARRAGPPWRGCAARGSWRSSRTIDAPGFRERQVAVLAETLARAARPRPGRGRGAAARGRGRLARGGAVRDRPALRGAVARLAEQGAVRLVDERDVRAPEGLPLARRRAGRGDRRTRRPRCDPLARGARGRRFRPFLLHGVTGSGKTEVYFRAAEAALARGRGALVLVPEIALTPMLVRAARSRFGGTVSVLHSELSAGERHDQWWRIREGDARVVVGARSAVFAPVPDLGLVVVDEEHDGVLQAGGQPALPRPRRGGDALAPRGLPGGPRLGDAVASSRTRTPCAGKYERLLAARSASGSRRLPSVEIVDRRAMLQGGLRPHPDARPCGTPSRPGSREASRALLLLNRRGYATSLLCRECGREAMCPNCSVSLTLHQGGRSALCHYCGHEAGAPTACPPAAGPTCASPASAPRRVVEAVQEALPRARVERLDRDRASRRGALAQVLAAFETGEIDILVGTQMIAKGHDFPRVTLVGVVDADVGLGMPGLPGGGADVPAPDAGGGSRRARRHGGRGDPAEPHARSLRPGPRLRPGLRRLLRAGDGVPADDGLPAGGRARERDRARSGAPKGRRRPRPWPARYGPRRAGATACSVPPTRRSRACATSTASRSCSRAIAPPCARRSRPRSSSATGRSAGLAWPWTWIPCRVM